MRRMRIFTKGLSSEQVPAAAELAREAGFADEEVDTIEEVGAPIPSCEDEMLMIVLSSSTCLDPSLNGDLLSSHATGARRAICVWPHDADAESAPPEAALKYAYSIIPWDANKLREVAADDDVLHFEAPTGAPLPNAPMERNLCVEEDA